MRDSVDVARKDIVRDRPRLEAASGNFLIFSVGFVRYLGSRFVTSVPGAIRTMRIPTVRDRAMEASRFFSVPARQKRRRAGLARNGAGGIRFSGVRARSGRK